ncbi:MAG: aminoacetone oxidase family FAD-binding enzyme, partial [Anaerolineales bacterium]|nr:aminoacetone oxidase family FAD-binding enzyme [Anaerolineales bacterium]
KTEPDGRVFPASDRSQSVIDCLLGQAAQHGITLHTRRGLNALQPTGQGFQLETSAGPLFARRLLLAPGGGSASAYQLARNLGHTILPPVPSLFTFNIEDPRLAGLAGISVPQAALTLQPAGHHGPPFQAQGPLLITHWGLSGPAVLKLSAWAARALAASHYRAELQVNWDGEESLATRLAGLQAARTQRARQTIAKMDPGGRLPQRLWQALVSAAGLPAQQTWAQASNAQLQALAEQLSQASFQVQGKGVFKEEFVTCGGVSLQEVDFRSMQSRLMPGLYFAGEYLDIDALTGGFNFQAAWTTGWLAGRHMGESLLR